MNLQFHKWFDVKMLAVIGCLLGLPLGVAAYTFIYGKGYSYLTQNPRACLNCHVMNEAFDSWKNSSHHTMATCNDCHIPEGFFSKYQAKLSNGFWHSFAFTTGKFHEPIQIKPHNLKIVEQSCLNCHKTLLEASHIPVPSSQKRSCVECHLSTGHVP